MEYNIPGQKGSSMEYNISINGEFRFSKMTLLDR